MSESSRDVVLARIRQGLAQPAPLPPRPDFASPVHPPLSNSDAVVAFAESFQRVGGEFYYCESLAHLAVQIAGFQQRQQVGAPYVWEPHIQALLRAAGVAFKADEADFIEHADLGLTSCEALVARTGSVLVSAATASGRRLSIYPDQHLVLARPSQVVAEIGEALRVVQAKFGAQMPSMVSLTTGPSRTADIEKTLVLGAHGPRRLALFLLEDDAALT
ncbi:LUD domain-containing protein [Hymenobacter sp. BT770]|uniref:LutC/YkgG family protein n=1 Tax=Hymenobacter sp. BT770 TaxID=2886942 RepID=UPI001D114286|nr:LUD domain-containing protein [Hymenobacter sp. BT770]MCC3153311.1 LUD domain-containing protein [Hymenobacter sp. BT770]MDO3414306.1 LUD domain-containing protein [Hymenobacter sp. BT770]